MLTSKEVYYFEFPFKKAGKYSNPTDGRKAGDFIVTTLNLTWPQKAVKQKFYPKKAKRLARPPKFLGSGV